MCECCTKAVRRTYSELMRKGVSDSRSFEVAVNVFAIHHPEVQREEAAYLVAEWIADDDELGR